MPDPNERSLARTVLGGTGIITAAGFAGRLFGLVSSPILTRVLGPTPYGEVALVGTVTSLATTLALFGVDMSYARFYFSGSPDESAAVERFCWRFTMATSLCVSFLAAAAWWWLAPRAGQPSGYAVMVGAGIFLGAVNAMGSLRRRVRGGYTRIAASIAAGSGIGMVLAIVIALSIRRDAWALLVGTAGGVAASIAILGLPGKAMLRGSLGLSRTHQWDVVRLGLTSMVTAPMFWLMNSADRWFLGIWKGEGELGVYAFAGSVGMIGLMLNSAITMTWFPEMNRAYEAMGEDASSSIGRMWARLVASLLVVWVAVSAAGGDVLRLFSDPRFHGGVPLVPWLAGAVFFYGVALLANTGLFLRKDLTPVVGWWVAGAAANVALNAALVRPLGAIGAAAAACLGFALIAAGVTWSSQGRFRLPIPWGRLSAAGGIAIGGIAILYVPWAASPLTSLLLKLPAGAVCALMLMMVVAPDWVRRIFHGEFRSAE
jgi:O-antigen/teichoic acid export membrane protein